MFEHDRLYDPELVGEHRLPARATVIPARRKGVFYRNRLSSELLVDLNGDWAFAWREEDDLGDFWRTDYDDTGWETLAVPSMWQYHGYSEPVYPNVEYPIPFVPPYVGNVNPVGYYRRRFTATAGGRRILYFGGVDSAFFVYLNGEYVGFSKGSRIPAEFDVTALVREGENLLCVKVFTYSDATYLENQDMLLASGIFRDVMLYTLADVGVWDYTVYTKGDDLLVELELFGTDFTNSAICVTVDGRHERVEGVGKCSLCFAFENPVRWNAEQPYTYEVTIEVLREEQLLEVHTKRVGFAEYRVVGNRVLLNGTPITIKGINRHEHDPKNGRAITVERIERELALIKAQNMNAIRCSHYPNNPAFYEIATELGIYVMDEADIETHGAHVCGDMGYFSKHPRWWKAYFDRTSRMYERDKNETCISIWTIGNENGDGENVHKCVQYLKNQTVKKPVMHTGDDSKHPVVSDFRECAYFTMAELMDFPPEGEPLVMLEYGHAMGNSPGLMKDTWDYVYHNRHVCGGYVWEFKNHGFYREDAEGRAAYLYGGDFKDDINHWSNFSMDGYCQSDGTPGPALAECKNVLAPTYITYEDGKILLMNTNDFRPLDYVTLEWEIAEDYTPIRSGQMRLSPVLPYESAQLPLDTTIDNPIAGAEYFVNLRFLDETGYEIAKKQISLGVLKAKEEVVSHSCHFVYTSSADTVTVEGEGARIGIKGGLLTHLEKDGRVLIDAPMRLNLYRAPIDNDGIVGWHRRWIDKWDDRLYRHFRFVALNTKVETLPDGRVRIQTVGKWTPISKFVGFDVTIIYTVGMGGRVLVDMEAHPYGAFAETLPRLGFVIPMASDFNTVTWYGRGEDECYADRYEHCPLGRYQKDVADMNFIYDVPQECGTRIDTRYLQIGGKDATLGVVGSDRFAFSYHDFTLEDLIAARHLNELSRSSERYLYVDYAMRGLGSKSCGPDPEECYELRAHPFRFVFLLAPSVTEETLLADTRSHLGATSARLGPTHVYVEKTEHINLVECNKE